MAKRIRYKGRDGKRFIGRTGKHLAGTALLLLTVAVLLQPAFPAVSAVPESPAGPDQIVRVIPPAEPAQAAPDLKGPAVPESPEAPETEAPQAPADMTVPESEPVEDTYFADAVFLGDSRTEGFHLYSGLQEGQYLFSVGATAVSVFTKETQQTVKGTVPMLDALADMDCGKVYIMLGVNELGWPRAELYKEQYGKIIDRVREEHPETEVVIQSLLPVSAEQEAKGSYVNNERIAVYNELLEELAVEKQCPYLNVAEAVTGEDGCLKAELSADGVHLNKAGCRVWLDYLRTHAV